MKLKLFLSGIILCSILTGVEAQSLEIDFYNGNKTTIALTALEKLLFSNNNLSLIYTTGETNSLSVSAINRLLFNDVIDGNSQMDVSDNHVLKLYPNPAIDFLTLSCSSDDITSATIFRMDGARIKTLVLSSGQQSIDVSGLSKGMYVLLINNQILKFTKQ